MPNASQTNSAGGEHHQYRRVDPSLRRRLLAHAEHLTSSADAAEDLLQELYARLPDLLDRVPRIGGPEGDRVVGAYLCRCLRNLARHQRTGDDRRRSLRREFGEAAWPMSTNPWRRIETKILTEEVLDILRANHLSDEEIRLLRWRYLDDRPVEDIARRLGLSVGAARKRIERAVRRAQDIVR